MSKSIIKNSFYSVIKTVSSSIFPVISFSYASRILLADGMGRIDFSKSVVSIFTMIGMLGIQNYGIREGARIKDDRVKLSCLSKELIIINLISVGIAYALLIASTLLSNKLIEYSEIIFLYSVTLGLTVIGVEWLYSAVENFRYIAVRTCLIQIISLILMLILVKTKSDIYKYVIIQVISSGGAFVFNFFHARKYVDFSIKCKINLKRHIKPILYLFAMTVFIKIFTDMDTAMLGVISDNKSVGLYSAAYKMSFIVSGIIGAATTVLVPQMSFLIENKRHNEANDLLRKSLHFCMLLGIPLLIGAFIFSKTFLLILSGNNFAAANTAARILTFRGLLSPINGVFLLNYLMAYKKDKLCVFITAITALFNIVVNYLLIPDFQQNGAALATVAAEGIEFIMLLCVISKSISLKFLFKGTWKYIISSIIMTFAALFIQFMIENILIELIISVIVAATVYFIFLKIFRCEFFSEFEKILKKK